MEINNELTLKEKKILMEDLFPKEKVYIDNVANFLSDNFKKIDGFDYRWSSLITSKPLLFEDVDYVRVRDNVRNEIKPEELEAYKSGKLRNIYSTFETMLIMNLPFYDRIMSFCTMIFHKYIRLPNDECVNQGLKNIPYFFEMTPTQIWCCALTNEQSTDWELNYAWKTTHKAVIKNKPTKDQSWLEVNFKYLYKNQTFARFIEYRAFICDTKGFKQTFFADITSNRKLSQVCSKFTRTSTALDEGQLDTLSEYIYEDNKVMSDLHNAISECLDKEFSKGHNYGIWVFKNEFFIYTHKFKMKIVKDDENNITKQYLSNSYECFAAELLLVDSVKAQINWAKHKQNSNFEYDKNVLIGILYNMLQVSGAYKDLKCVRFMQNTETYSEVVFQKVFCCYRAIETFYFNGKPVYEYKTVLGASNMAKYLVNRGYYIFGSKHDVDIMFTRDVTKDVLIRHYMNYCVPVISHMSDVIMLHTKNNNDIIDFMLTGQINPIKINNKNIKYTLLRSNNVDNKSIMNQMRKNNDKLLDNKDKLTYFQAIK